MYISKCNSQEIIITQFLGLQIASELLAEASNKATANDWLTLIAAKSKARYEEMPRDEWRDTLMQAITTQITPSESESKEQG